MTRTLVTGSTTGVGRATPADRPAGRGDPQRRSDRRTRPAAGQRGGALSPHRADGRGGAAAPGRARKCRRSRLGAHSHGRARRLRGPRSGPCHPGLTGDDPGPRGAELRRALASRARGAGPSGSARRALPARADHRARRAHGNASAQQLSVAGPWRSRPVRMPQCRPEAAQAGRVSQKATADAAATFSESTPWDIGIRTVRSA